MGNIKAEEAMKELTLMLLYLSRFTQGEKFHEATDFYAWKGYVWKEQNCVLNLRIIYLLGLLTKKDF